MKNLKWRGLLIVFIIGFSIWMLYPYQEKINLGLDLQGGLHVVLEVQIDEAVKFDTNRLKEDIRIFLESKDIRIKNTEVIGLDQFKIIFANDKMRSQGETMVRKNFNQQIEAKEEQFDYVVFRLKEAYQKDIRSRALRQAKEVMVNRIDKFGVAEPSIQTQGDNRIIVQLPGIQDIARAQQLLQQTAQLEFRLVSEDEEKLKEALAGTIPPGYEVMYMERQREGHMDRIPLLVKKVAELTGASLKDARPTFDSQYNTPTVTFELDKTGAKIFADVTKNNIDRPLAIVLDGVVVSAPKIQSEIPDGSGVITGSFTPEEARDLAVVLTSGALPAPVKKIQDMRVGPSLGADSIKQGLYSGAAGMILVALYIIIYYMLGGLIANLALILNVVIIMGAMAMLKATLTLPGIAGIILTVGMAVDANILIFERIREELENGKKVRSAIDAGYKRAFITIFDSNITTIFSALILYQFGTGPVRGFAVTLMIGLLASMFTAVYVTRFIYDLLSLRQSFSNVRMLKMFGKTNFNFVKHRFIAYALSILVIAAGLVSIGIRGKNLFGVDFTGGDILQVKFNQHVPIEEIRKSIAEVGFGDAVIQEFGAADEVLIRSRFESSQSIFDQLQKDFGSKGIEERRREEIGPAIGKDLRANTLWALFYSILGILIYVAWRFDFEFGVGAIVALIHDVLVSAGAIALSGKELSISTVAALLTIIGYSINDTIVICDRVRENLKIMRKSTITEIIDASINQTLSRTINTNITVFFVVVALWMFGGEVINGFAFTMFIGMIAGTYSTAFIACPIIMEWRNWKERRTKTQLLKSQNKKKVGAKL